MACAGLFRRRRPPREPRLVFFFGFGASSPFAAPFSETVSGAGSGGNIVIDPDTFEKNRRPILSAALLVVEGSLEQYDGVTSVICLCYTPNIKGLQTQAKNQTYEPEWVVTNYPQLTLHSLGASEVVHLSVKG